MYVILKHRLYLLYLILLVQTSLSVCYAETIINTRFIGYQRSLLLLVLEKTIPSHGQFKVHIIDKPMNVKRAKQELLVNTYPNFVLASIGGHQLFKQYAYAPFPIDLGLFGYRFPVHHIDNITNFSNIDSIEQLKHLDIIQGAGWFDSKILRANGFSNVNEARRESLEQMVLTKRSEIYFCSLGGIKKNFKQGLVVNKHFGLRYSIPRFFIVHKDNQALSDRLYAGLVLAYNDGSLKKLMDEFFFHEVSKQELFNRRFLALENVSTQGIDQRYFQWVKKLSDHFSVEE